MNGKQSIEYLIERFPVYYTVKEKKILKSSWMKPSKSAFICRSYFPCFNREI